MAKRESSSRKSGLRARARRAGTAIKRAVRRAKPRRHQAAEPQPAVAAKPARPRTVRSEGHARPTQRKPDIPIDVLNRTYIPTQTSLKTSFRSDGAERERDQEFAGGFADERWGDEDHYTNKSGDPRIGTHRGKYEPRE